MPDWSRDSYKHQSTELKSFCDAAISHERQYNQFFVLKVCELELRFVKQTNNNNKNFSLWANRAYELCGLSRARHILVQITSVRVVLLYVRTKKQFFIGITTIFMLFSESSQFHTVVFITCEWVSRWSFHVDSVIVFTADSALLVLLNQSQRIWSSPQAAHLFKCAVKKKRKQILTHTNTDVLFTLLQSVRAAAACLND